MSLKYCLTWLTGDVFQILRAIVFTSPSSLTKSSYPNCPLQPPLSSSEHSQKGVLGVLFYFFTAVLELKRAALADSSPDPVARSDQYAHQAAQSVPRIRGHGVLQESPGLLCRDGIALQVMVMVLDLCPYLQELR